MSTFQHPFQEDPDKPPVLQEPQPFSQGLVQIYTGDGKGKSSAAFGVVMRAVGYGLKVYCGLFMKGDMRYGELAAARYLPGVTVERFGPDYLVDLHNISEEEKAVASVALEHAERALRGGEYNVVVLDEINVAARWKLISIDDVVERIIKQRPPEVELILTGRYAPPQFIALADYVTDMCKVKHPYDQGILSREGIDF